MNNLRKNLSKVFVVLFAFVGVFMFAACKKETPPETPEPIMSINGFDINSINAKHNETYCTILISLTNNNATAENFNFHNVMILDAEETEYSHTGMDRYFTAGQQIEYMLIVDDFNVENLTVGETLTVKYVDEIESIDIVIGTVVLE